ncbi:MAG: carbohydrate ABC transporter permease [Oscillospiraceae bacterium]|nr:carbohydrate ABC transporter permease [Oscillospiraceae bacterium]
MITKSDKRWAFSGHVVLGFIAVCSVAPFILLIIASFTDEAASLRNGYSFTPEKWSKAAYEYILLQWDTIGRAYMITIFITVVGTFSGVMMAGMLGYSLAQKDLPGRNIITFLIMFTMLFNGGLTATYIVYTQVFHIKNTIFGLLVPNLLLNAFSIVLFRNYFEFTMEKALLEAARIDGASEMRTFWSIVLPLSLPMIATVGLMSALMYWNDWINGIYYLSPNSKMQSIQTLLNRINEDIRFLQQNSTVFVPGDAIPSTTVRMAIAVVGILPILLLYPFFQKWFVRGVATGAVKG